ncbi:MAG: hypothetical protein FWB85_04100 [Chitinispirillia bacterium]|nr:hypothetical protein [Chitinispirillia bacterium]MCL2241590.1 hypothetical protein [Chitinispirillia bacterium]
MSKYAIAFIVPADKAQLRHGIVDGENRDSALRTFFGDNAVEFYSNDEGGFLYFKEDFFLDGNPSGSIIELGV